MTAQEQLKQFDKRLHQIERCLVAWTTLASGEAARLGTPEQVAAVQKGVAQDLLEISQRTRDYELKHTLRGKEWVRDHSKPI